MEQQAAGERYLTKSNTWATVASIPGTYTFDVSRRLQVVAATVNSGDTLGIEGGTYITTDLIGWSYYTNKPQLIHLEQTQPLLTPQVMAERLKL